MIQGTRGVSFIEESISERDLDCLEGVGMLLHKQSRNTVLEPGPMDPSEGEISAQM